MHTDAQECTKMRMGKNPTTFGKKPHSTHDSNRLGRPPRARFPRFARFGRADPFTINGKLESINKIEVMRKFKV